MQNSINLISWKERKALLVVLKPIYQAVTANVATAALENFSEGEWGQKFLG